MKQYMIAVWGATFLLVTVLQAQKMLEGFYHSIH